MLIHVLMGFPSRTQCKPLCMKHQILPLSCLFILETLINIYGNLTADHLVASRSRLRTTKFDVNMYTNLIRKFSDVSLKIMNSTTF